MQSIASVHVLEPEYLSRINFRTASAGLAQEIRSSLKELILDHLWLSHAVSGSTLSFLRNPAAGPETFLLTWEILRWLPSHACSILNILQKRL